MTTLSAAELPDFKPAPNQGGHARLYELENQALDPDGHVLAAMRARAPWAGRALLDLGCGSGFWLGRYADEAAQVRHHALVVRVVDEDEPVPDRAVLAATHRRVRQLNHARATEVVVEGHRIFRVAGVVHVTVLATAPGIVRD